VSLARVSVVVPNYNHAAFLRERVSSVLNQTFENFEVILLDDCSTDGSREILSKYANYPRVRVAFNEKNSGSTFKQWNRGVELSRGEYIWIAESDDFADERLLERLVAALDAEPEASFAYCRSWRVDKQNRLHGFVDQYLTDLHPTRWAGDYCSDGLEECAKYFVFRNMVANASGVLFRKSVYELVGGADESLKLCGDWKLWAAMALAGKVVHIGDPLNYFRSHDNSVSGKDAGRAMLAQETLNVVSWLLKRVSIPETEQRKIFRSLSDIWIPAVITRRVSLRARLQILKTAISMDPLAVRRLIRPTFKAMWLKVRKHVYKSPPGDSGSA
jgi:glycosyltransferase involved in cell wall biosynthesis